MLNISKKQFKFSFACLLGTLFFSTLFLTRLAETKSKCYEGLKKEDLSFDFTWLKSTLKKYPEMSWFTNQTFLGRNVGSDPLTFTFSQIKKTEYNDYEKLIFMLYHLKLFIDSDYTEFQQMALFQDRLRLEFQAFHSIKNEILETLAFREGIDKQKLHSLLELSLIYSQIHFSQKAQDKAFIYEIKTGGEKNFFSQVQECCPTFFPSLEILKANEKELLLKLIDFTKLDALFCMDYHKRDQVQFQEHDLYSSDENLFDLIFFLYRCYCPSTHLFSVDQNVFYHQKLHNFLHGLKKSFLVMQTDGTKPGLDHYIKSKREIFELDETSIIDLVLEPIFFKLYFLDKHDSQVFRKIVTDLSPTDLSRVITYLKDDCLESTAFITNVIQTLFEQNQEGNLANVFKDSMNLFIKVLTFLEGDTNIKVSVKALDDSNLIKFLRLDASNLMAKDISVDHRGTIRVMNN